MPDLTRCTVCNRRAELNEYGECPACEEEIGETLLVEGIPERRAAAAALPPMRLVRKAAKRGAA